MYCVPCHPNNRMLLPSTIHWRAFKPPTMNHWRLLLETQQLWSQGTERRWIRQALASSLAVRCCGRLRHFRRTKVAHPPRSRTTNTVLPRASTSWTFQRRPPEDNPLSRGERTFDGKRTQNLPFCDDTKFLSGSKSAIKIELVDQFFTEKARQQGVQHGPA